MRDQAVDELLELSRLLGEFGQINRVTLLPNGQNESDSHHSFSLALIAYELACQYAPELETRKILLYALAHDLPELITGDVNTLTASSEQLHKKSEADKEALKQAEAVLSSAPSILRALKAYEEKSDDEALFVYWIDKMITIPTHFYDNGANLRKLGIQNRGDIEQWYIKTLSKLQQKRAPHSSAVMILELAYKKMRDELLGP